MIVSRILGLASFTLFTALAVVACGDSTSDSADDNGSGNTSGSSSATCCLNGAGYRCPSEAAVNKCFDDRDPGDCSADSSVECKMSMPSPDCESDDDCSSGERCQGGNCVEDS